MNQQINYNNNLNNTNFCYDGVTLKKKEIFQLSNPSNNLKNINKRDYNSYYSSNFNSRDINDFCENQINESKEYLNPNNMNISYPNVTNEWKNENVNNADNNCREQNNRTKMGNINSFMERSLQNVNFIDSNNSKNIWSNPIANNSFPNFYTTDCNSIDNDDINYLGMNTRKTKKTNECDLHLKRSMLQPDFRHGNRFYEIKPTNTRRENYKGIGNDNARKFQDQTEEMYKSMNWSKAYDNVAGIGRT